MGASLLSTDCRPSWVVLAKETKKGEMMWVIRRKSLRQIIIDWLKTDIRNLAYDVHIQLREVEKRERLEAPLDTKPIPHVRGN
jgi:hypothetical protein